MASRLAQATVRSYRQADREAVMRLAADSAAFGEPVEAFLDDRRLFCDAVNRFRLLGARPTRLRPHVTDQPVENRCYGLRLK